MGSAAYTINLPAAATPTFNPATGTYTSVQTVTISDTTAASSIYYTTNGTAPTTASTLYSAPITVAVTQTVEAIAVLATDSISNVATAAYTINLPRAATPTFASPAGTYTSIQSVTISDATAGTSTPAVLTTPSPNTSTPLSGASVAFSWNSGNTAAHFEFYVGTTGGGFEQSVQLRECDGDYGDCKRPAHQRVNGLCAPLLAHQWSLATCRLHLLGILAME